LPFDGHTILNSTHAMLLETIPSSLIIAGAGAIGVEYAHYFAAMGARVTIVEMLDHLVPIEDPDVSATLEKAFTKRNIDLHLGRRIDKAEPEGAGVTVSLDNGEQLQAGKLLVSIGVIPNISSLGLEAAGILLDRTAIAVDDHCRTSVTGIYAIGDVTRPPWLAHKASAEGIIAAESIAGLDPHPLDYDYIPACTFCSPQIASIGLTEPKARERHGDVKIGRFFFRANGRALAGGDYDGFIKTIFHPATEELLGVHMIGPEVTELISEASAFRTLQAKGSQIHSIIHPHPTLAEAFPEAVAAAFGTAIHGA
ncbi:FAD-dependent oxidoreductase, partial [bacterium]|nr:FAD-dependent oxidoreductase [candidate division CSSED10-310 bacterium]